MQVEMFELRKGCSGLARWITLTVLWVKFVYMWEFQDCVIKLKMDDEQFYETTSMGVCTGMR